MLERENSSVIKACHLAFIAGSGSKTTDKICSPRPRYKNGVTSQWIFIKTFQAAFTLIELSIVIVIIGLIVGGVLVGRDLINAAEVRSQISQIEKYNTAANTFKIKYGYLPGDISDPTATAFGFSARGQYAGEGDGNGSLEGVWLNVANANNGYFIASGETALFWVDLGKSNLIDQVFPVPVTYACTGKCSSTSLPQAKITGNSIYVSDYSDGAW